MNHDISLTFAGKKTIISMIQCSFCCKSNNLQCCSIYGIIQGLFAFIPSQSTFSRWKILSNFKIAMFISCLRAVHSVTCETEQERFEF